MITRYRLFREEVLKRRSTSEPVDRLLRVTAPHEWMFLGLLGAVVLGVLIWSVFGRIERSLLTDCLLVQPGPRHSVTSRFTGVIREILVRPGDPVAAGQPIARLGVPEVEQKLSIVRERVALLDAQEQKSGTVRAYDERVALQAELLELLAIKAASEYLTSPRAGEITTLKLARDRTVSAGEVVAQILSEPDRPREVFAFVPTHGATRIGADTPVRIMLTDTTDRNIRGIDAGVLEVYASPEQAPGWFVDLDIAFPPGSHLVRLTLSSAPEATAVSDASCRARFILGMEAPVFLLKAPGTL